MKCKHCGRSIRMFTKTVKSGAWVPKALRQTEEIWTVGGSWGSACREVKVGAGYGQHEPDLSTREALEQWLDT